MINWDALKVSFEIMGQGMAGIFVTVFIIMIFVWLLSLDTEEKKDKPDQE